MGIFDKIKNKIAGFLEKEGTKNMDEKQRAEYEKEKAANAPIKHDIEKLEVTFTKEETNDLENLLIKLGALDNRKLWIGGFLKLRTNQNARAANLFTGIKNLKMLANKDDIFYMISFDGNKIHSYKEFKKDQVAKVSYKKEFEVRLHDQTGMNLSITKNKQKANELFSALK